MNATSFQKHQTKPRPKKQGLLIVLSSPSGGGKTTLAHQLLRRDKNIIRSVSCTTRKPRLDEKNGKDYFFVTTSRFQQMKARKAFLEWAQVHQNFYGTPKPWVLKQIEKGKDVLLVIDVQGGRSIQKLYRKALLIFLMPPSLKVLKERLSRRQSEDDDSMRVRLQGARKEIREGRHYAHRVVNDRLPLAVAEVLRIIRFERKKTSKSL